MAVNISDVAEKANLSRSTVSRVLNHYAHVSDDKRQRVEQAIRELGYTPNIVAKQLREKNTNLIGVLVPDIRNPYFSYLLYNIEEHLNRLNYQIMIFQSKLDHDKEIEVLNLLNRKQIDGLIISDLNCSWAEIEPYARSNKLVVANYFFKNKEMNTIQIDQTKASFEGVEYLINKGYKRIGYCKGGPIDPEDLRYIGYLKALKKHGLPLVEELLYPDILTIEDGRQLLRQILSDRQRPDAVFTGSDEVAAGMIAEANRLGVRIPEELAVLGFDDQPIAELITPTITTLRQPIDLLAKEIAETMVRQLNQEESATTDCSKILIHAELIVRQSA